MTIKTKTSDKNDDAAVGVAISVSIISKNIHEKVDLMIEDIKSGGGKYWSPKWMDQIDKDYKKLGSEIGLLSKRLK